MRSRMLATFAVLALSTATASSHGAPDAAALIGSWKLVSYEDRDANSASVYPYGKAPAGLLVYDATGHMAIQIMTTPPPDVASGDWNLFTVKEKIALYDAYIAYFGRYEVDSARKIVIHLPEADLSRLYIGRREERHYELAGDRLVLAATWTQNGKTWSGTRVFQRLR